MTQAQKATDSWTDFREFLRAGVSQSNWETWLSRLEPDFDGDEVVLVAPTEFHLPGDVIEKITTICRPPLHQIEVFGQEGDNANHTKEVCSPLEAGLVHLGPPGSLGRDLDLDQAVPLLARDARPNDSRIGLIGYQSGVRDRSERLQRRQVGDGLEKVGLPSSVGADEEIDPRVRAPFECAIRPVVEK